MKVSLWLAFKSRAGSNASGAGPHDSRREPGESVCWLGAQLTVRRPFHSADWETGTRLPVTLCTGRYREVSASRGRGAAFPEVRTGRGHLSGQEGRVDDAAVVRACPGPPATDPMAPGATHRPAARNRYCLFLQVSCLIQASTLCQTDRPGFP
ncbi:formate hydrogenase [Platysternon megacephalum]|uniref:Formate hydrogenase n=1 Tax=Platysternon megacephalum TaxID=55544 RepID=A0A4D9DHB6_9SAUR|nr:formate hydrogenase [Platysternon megacephalum]